MNQNNQTFMEQCNIAKRFRGFLPVVVDLETGGFNADTDAVLEISMVIIGMDPDGYLIPEKQISAHVIPFKGANLDPAALEFTGINPFHPLRIASTEKEALEKILPQVREAIRRNRCNRAILVGHNAHFDLKFLNNAIDRNGIKRTPFHQFSCFDTATLAGLVYGQTVLSRACDSAAIKFDQQEAHSAKYDAEKTSMLFCKMVNRFRDLGGWPTK